VLCLTQDKYLITGISFLLIGSFNNQTNKCTLVLKHVQ
jgi:hypothetical protein